MILGAKECELIVETYCSKLCSHTQSALDTTRKTPRFLGVIATPDDRRLQKGREGKKDSALLRWDVVKGYLGSNG